MGTSTRRNFLRSAGILGSGLTFASSLIPRNLLAQAATHDLPYYKPGAPLTTDMCKGEGEAFTLQGIVYRHDGKTPLADATVEIWHCDRQGNFDFSNRYHYRGKTVTDQHGRYRMKTNFPSRHQEKGRLKMSRIFMLVNGASHQQSFSTLYFDLRKQPYIDGKHWNGCTAAQKAILPKRTETASGIIITCNHYLRANSFFLSSPQEIAARQVHIFPTGNNQSNLTFGNVRPGHVAVRLFDRNNRVVQQRFVKNVKAEQSILLHDENLPAGVYTCSIFSSRFGRFVKRLAIG